MPGSRASLALGVLSRFRHYVNIEAVPRRLERLLRDFPMGSDGFTSSPPIWPEPIGMSVSIRPLDAASALCLGSVRRGDAGGHVLSPGCLE